MSDCSSVAIRCAHGHGGFKLEVRRQRNLRRLTLEILSAKVGMLPQHLSEIESGKHDPRLSSIKRIFDADPILTTCSD
jgi:transcriptional regulator with XRE-family HTH domain